MIMKTQKLLLALLLGLSILSSCTKEKELNPVHDFPTFRERMLYENEPSRTRLFAGKLLNDAGDKISQGGMVSLFLDNEEIDVYVSDDGYYQFEDLPYGAYKLKYYFPGYETKIVKNRYPQNTLYYDTLYQQQ